MYLEPEEKEAVPEMIWNFKTLAIQWIFLKEGDFLKFCTRRNNIVGEKHTWIQNPRFLTLTLPPHCLVTLSRHFRLLSTHWRDKMECSLIPPSPLFCVLSENNKGQHTGIGWDPLRGGSTFHSLSAERLVSHPLTLQVCSTCYYAGERCLLDLGPKGSLMRSDWCREIRNIETHYCYEVLE